MSAAFACALLIVPFAQEARAGEHADKVTLDALIERSRSIGSFRAEYAMTKTGEESLATLRLEFQASVGLRWDMEHDDERMSSWVHGSVMDMRGSSAAEKFHVHLDLELLSRELEPIEQALELAFPSSAPAAHGYVGGLLVRWSYDRATDGLDFNLSAGATPNTGTPLGWLKTLADKRAEPVEDGDHLRFSTDDGHFDVVVSRSTGLLEEFVGRKQTGEFAIKLVSLSLDEPIDAVRFEVPPAVEGSQDLVDAMRPMMEQSEREELRTRVYTSAANACATAEVEPALRAKFESVMRPLRETMCRARFAPWLAKLREGLAPFADRVRQQHEAGASDEVIDQNCEQYERKMIANFDASEEKYTATLEIPARAATAGCAAQLLATERELCTSLFRDLVRQPILDEFERAIEVARR